MSENKCNVIMNVNGKFEDCPRPARYLVGGSNRINDFPSPMCAYHVRRYVGKGITIKEIKESD